MENVPKTEQRIWKIFVIWAKTEEIKRRGKKINKWVVMVCEAVKQTNKLQDTHSEHKNM